MSRLGFSIATVLSGKLCVAYSEPLRVCAGFRQCCIPDKVFTLQGGFRMLLTVSRDTWSMCIGSFVVAVARTAARDESSLHNHERCYHPEVPWFRVRFEYFQELICCLNSGSLRLQGTASFIAMTGLIACMWRYDSVLPDGLDRTAGAVSAMGIFSHCSNKESAASGLIIGITFAAVCIICFKFLHPEHNESERWWWGYFA